MILLDYGHGKNRKGKTWEDLEEWKFNRDVGRFLELELMNRRICYSVLVTEDIDISISKRIERSKNISHDLLVSIHGNRAFTDQEAAENDVTRKKTATGLETWYHSEGGKIAAEIFQRHLVKRLGWKDRGIKKGNFGMIKKTPERAILTENGFYTNDLEREKMLDPHFQTLMAIAHADAIEEFLTLNNIR